MSDTRLRPTVPCSNEHCGGTIYEPTYAWTGDAHDPKGIWRCCNCGRETPRISRKGRKTLSLKRWDLISAIRKEWSETDDALHRLVDAGLPSGCLLVHGCVFNWHLDRLTEKRKPTRRDLAYHGSQAREDLERAKEFVQSKGGQVRS